VEGLGLSNEHKALAGRWELVFSTLLNSGKGGYFRRSGVTEICDFLGSAAEREGGQESNTFSLQSRFSIVPNLLVTVKGPSRLEIERGRPQVFFAIHAIKVWSLSIPLPASMRKENGYTFIYIGENMAVARSTRGGLSLMQRVT
jgi:hypothetical protein